jgi:hypothetical protein
MTFLWKKPVLTISNYEIQVNRTAKLKQCKLDVRREQWLSQRSQGESLLWTHMMTLHMLIGVRSTEFQRLLKNQSVLHALQLMSPVEIRSIQFSFLAVMGLDVLMPFEMQQPLLFCS